MPKTNTINANSTAERAHAESKVISSNLEHLATRVAEIDPQLRDDLHTYADGFERYVQRLGEACGHRRQLPTAAARSGPR
jgi:hypothetical protein